MSMTEIAPKKASQTQIGLSGWRLISFAWDKTRLVPF